MCSCKEMYSVVLAYHEGAHFPREALPAVAGGEHEGGQLPQLLHVVGYQLLVALGQLVAEAPLDDLAEGGHAGEDGVGGVGDQGGGAGGRVLAVQLGLLQLVDLLEEDHGIVAIQLVALGACTNSRLPTNRGPDQSVGLAKPAQI